MKSIFGVLFFSLVLLLIFSKSTLASDAKSNNVSEAPKKPKNTQPANGKFDDDDDDDVDEIFEGIAEQMAKNEQKTL